MPGRLTGQGDSRWSRLTLRAVDAGIAGVLLVAPLFMGGRHDVGRLIYVALVGWTLVAWMLHRCLAAKTGWRWTGAEWLLLAGTGLVLLQLTPLPSGMLAMLSPETGRLLPLWSSSGGASVTLGPWESLSLTPAATRGGLVILLAHVMLFLVVVQRLESVEDIRRLVRWLALAAIVMAGIGLAQFLFGNGKFLWIYDHPSRSTFDAVKGPFQNQNHFAHLLALGVGPLIWWLATVWQTGPPRRFGSRLRQSHRQSAVKIAACLGMGLAAIAALLTFSRGGIAVVAMAATVCCGIHWRRGLIETKALVWVGGGLAAVLVMALAIHGIDSLSQELRSLTDARSFDELCSERMDLWRSQLQAIPSFLATGTGVGSHREVYPIYLAQQYDVEFTHGENGYLQILLETGLPGLLLMLCGAMVGWRWCWRCLRAKGAAAEPGLAAAMLAGVTVSLLHSLGDFVWYIPACMSWTVVLLACAGRLYQETATARSANHAIQSAVPQRWNTANFGWLGISAALVVVLLADRLPPARVALCWDDYFRVVQELKQGDEADASQQQVIAMATSLDRLLQSTPDNARANLRMAGLCLRLFDIRQQASENPMALGQIRDAALASQFDDLAAQDQWLTLVLGDNWQLLDKAAYHARRAVHECPLQGEAYVYLGELAFLDGQDADAHARYLDQSLRVRPQSGVVLIAAGSEAALAGRSEKALDFWKLAFQQVPETRERIIGLMAGQLGAAEFIRQFDPDRGGLAQLYQFYRTARLTEPSAVVGRRYIAVLEAVVDQEPQATAAGTWATIAKIHGDCGDWRLAAECANRAVTLAPDDFGKRDLLARALCESQQYDRAITQLRWCLSRKPGHARLTQQLEAATRSQVVSHGGQAESLVGSSVQ